ncbi:MAG: aminomethyltransferase family protein [Candidatus Limnocylindrales bacterium]
MPDSPVQSAFHGVQEELGAEFGDWDGWLWTTGFGDRDGEYAAVRDSAGIWDCSALIKWDFHGSDALRAADRLIANDVLAYGPGRVRYAPLLDEHGRMVDDATIYVFGPDHVWFMTNRFDLGDHLRDVSSGLDVTIELIVHELPHVQFQGPRTREILQRHVSFDLATLAYFRFLTEPVKIGPVPAWIARTGVSGELGYELFVRPEHAEALWRTLTATGEVRPYGFDALDVLRIESGMILPGADYTPDESSPFDINFERFMRIDGRSFHGDRAIRAERDAGPPARRLASLTIEDGLVPEAGAEVTMGGSPVGTATSPTASPRFGTIALAILDQAAAAPGTRVEVALPAGSPTTTIGATVGAPTLYDPEKRRPRA